MHLYIYIYIHIYIYTYTYALNNFFWFRVTLLVSLIKLSIRFTRYNHSTHFIQSATKQRLRRGAKGLSYIVCPEYASGVRTMFLDCDHGFRIRICFRIVACKTACIRHPRAQKTCRLTFV